MKDTILVTGGTGYIGSHTVVALLEQGYDVAIIDNLSNSRIEVLDAIEQIAGVRPQFFKVDVTDAKALDATFKQIPNLKAVIHFAAAKAVGESVEKPLYYYHNNIVGLTYLLETMQAHKVNNIVFSSSCTVYGEPKTLPVVENSPIAIPTSPYGNTKKIGEEILQDWCKSGPAQVISLRYFNPVGAHSSALIGELPNGVPNNLVPFITQTAAGKREQLSIFGGDYETPDGTCIRDFIHVVDLAEAHLCALSRLLKKENKVSYEVFNVGTGSGYSVLQLVKVFEEVTGQTLNKKIVGRRPGDIIKIYADCQIANEVLKWKAKLGVQEMMASAWKWELHIKNNLKL